VNDQPASNLPEYSVSEIAGALKRTVETAFGQVRVRGELSQFRRQSSGHWYGSLKDERALIDLAMWKGTAAGLSFRPEDGLEVVITGKLTTYPGRSKYQLIVERMEPAGVGARNLAECLLLQIQKLEESLETSIAPTETIETLESMIVIARQIISDEKLLSSLGAREFTEICRHLQCDRERLRACIDFIQTLNPKPGSEFQNDAASVVIPDVIAFKTDGKRGLPWQVRLNESAVPRLSINPVYAELIKQDRASSMAPQLQEARWVIKNIQQRFDTILRVAQAIALEQQSFFEQGELAMKPLVLREIAQRCDLHESTVSRVTTNKYILTPKGTFELKYFFTSHVGTDSGGTASSTAIRAKIKQWVAAEDSKKPLSDQQIADRFGAEGIQVARRTIAKYREALRIEPVSQRKKL
jgi:RNA polymerase sigma-54 factor